MFESDEASNINLAIFLCFCEYLLANRAKLAKEVAQTIENSYKPERKGAETYDKEGSYNFEIHFRRFFISPDREENQACTAHKTNKKYE